MKYYEFKHIIDDKAPFIEGMSPQYWLKVKPNETIRDIPFSDFPLFTPFLDGFWREPEEELRDYISTVYDNNGLLMSNKMKIVLEQFHLPEHRFYPAIIQHGKKRVTDYWFFKYVFDPFDYIDYEQSKITFFPKKREVVKPSISITSISKMRKALDYAAQNRIGRTFKFEGQLFLNQKFNEIDLDFVEFRHLIHEWLISERLKTAIENAGLTGIEFIETNLIQIAE